MAMDGMPGGGTSPLGKDKCCDCVKSYRTCECKSCSKCGTLFVKYPGTGLIKGRSHCRLCRLAVCVTCHTLVKGRKVCTRCHLKQKEDEISTEKALTAIEEAKYGKSLEESAIYSKLKSSEQQKDMLFDAAKKGDDHILVIVLNMGENVNSTDSDKSTPLFYAAEGGHLTCVALLLERGANVKTVNNAGWTPLHVVAWKGSSDNHVECAQLLLQAGADAIAENHTNETAADVAERCGGRMAIVEILRAAEVDVSLNELREKIQTLQGLGPRERRLWRMTTALMNFVCCVQMGGDSQLSARPARKLLPPVNNVVRCSSLDRTIIRRNLCEKCEPSSSSSGKFGGSLDLRRNVDMERPQFGGSVDLSRPQADVEPIVRKTSLNHTYPGIDRSPIDQLDSDVLREKLKKSDTEKKDWELRCRKLLQSIATMTKEHQKEINELEAHVSRLKEEKEAELKKCEAEYVNKMAKVRQQADTAMWRAEKALEEAETSQRDITHLQKNHKLTWVPDELIKTCQNTKCRTPFSQTCRKHHCRCCGRVYCQNCSNKKTPILPFGYTYPVRTCGTCYALIEDLFNTEGEDETG